MAIFSFGWFILGNKIGLKHGIIGQKCSFIHLFLGIIAILIIYYWFIPVLQKGRGRRESEQGIHGND
jgi:hypothetical protein